MLILHAIYKKENGKSVNRRLRINDKFPGILYGKNNSPIALELDHNIVFNLQKKIEFYKENMRLIIQNKEHIVKVQAIQRHAFKLRLLHIDFIYV